MITRRMTLALLASTLLPVSARTEEKTHDMRPVPEDPAARMPDTPRRIDLAAMGREPGVSGGSVRTIIGSQKDIRIMTLNGYARLVGYDQNLHLQPDILESYEVEEGRIFTFRIRRNHRWSDGSLFTSRDFQYCWEDVVLNDALRPSGLPAYFLADQKPPRFEVIDDLTVRFTWDSPNPDFLPNIAAPIAATIVLPFEYLRQFHEKYQDADTLKKLMKAWRVKKWADLHIKASRTYRPENPDLPTLDPWRNTTKPPAEQFVFERNPYFHRCDENGTQLPYIDKFVLNISSPEIIPAKTGAGETELQSFGINFVDYAFLKDSEKRYPVKVRLWKSTVGSRVNLLPNLNNRDPVWRGLFKDVRFRRALSLAIDRHEINMAAFYGLAREAADSVLPESPLYSEKNAKAWATHDPAQANALLDAIGLTERNSDGIRLLPDGRTAQIVVETAGESTLETDILELVTDHWSKIGISLFVKPSQRDVFRSRAMGGEIMIAMSAGMENAVPTPDMNPGQLAPTMDDQLQWPVWSLNYMSRGEQGEAPDLPEVIELQKLLGEWFRTSDLEEQHAIWVKMLDIYTDQVFSIGIVNGSLQPVLHSARLKNIPEEGLYGFTPTCYFGVYMPDTFWFAKEVS